MEIQFQNLSFRYTPKKRVLHEIELTLPKKQFVAILGPNGSGKTTLMKQINRILIPQKGCVTADGQNLAKLSAGELARTIAYVPQMTSGIMAGSVMDTVMLGRKPYIKWKPSEEDIDIVSHCLLRFHLEEIAHRQFNALSGGQKQTVLIARALAQTPQIYLFDEPVSFLDVRNQREIMTAARELVEHDGKTVIMVLHDLNMALRFADHVVIMKEGHVYAQGAPRDVITEENVLAVYGTHAEIKNGEYVIASL